MDIAEFNKQVTDVSKITTDFYKDIQKRMRTAEYKYKRMIQSAQEELQFTKDDTRIVFTGWHGTGDWGTVKVCHNLYLGYNKVQLVSDLDDFDLVYRTYILRPTLVKQYQTNLVQAKKFIMDQINR